MPRPLSRPTALALALALFAAFGHALAAEEAVELSEIQVTGEAPVDGSATQGYRVDTVHLGPLGTASKQDLPFTVNTVSADLIRNTQATNTTDALKYVPTVYANTGASQITPYYTLRGFIGSQTSLNNVAVDGMRSFDIYEALDDKSGIEVMAGGTSFLYGITSPVGVINYQTKRPTATPLREVTVGIYDQQAYTQLDLGGPVEGHPEFAYRVNLAYADPGKVGDEHQSQERYVYSGVLDWTLSPATKLSFDTAYAKRDVDYTQPLFMTTAAIGIPDAPDASKNWGAPYAQTHDVTARIGATLEHRINDALTLRAKVRHTDIEREYRLTRQVWQNSDFDYRWRIDSQDPFHIVVDQYALFLDAEFDTGPLHHALSVGSSGDAYDKGYDGARSQTFATVHPGNLYGAPSYPDFTQPNRSAASAEETWYSTQTLVDRIGFGERWQLMLAATQARIAQNSFSRNATSGVVTTTSYDDSKLTPAAALSYKPLPALTTYVSYSEALQSGGTSTSSGNYGEAFAPFVGKQYEAGAKATLGGVDLALAWFDIDQANKYTVGTMTYDDGREIHRGWELTVTGKVTDRLTVIGGLTALDAHVEKASSAALIGKTPQGVPERMARLYAEYDLPMVPGLTVTGGASHTGKTPWDAANTLYVDPVTLFDAGLRYRTRTYGKETTYRLGVSNLTGKDYWTTRSGILYLGSSRVVAASATLAF